MDYIFDPESISQWIVKYGVNLRPPLALHEERARMQSYCSWLTERYAGYFETLSSGPGHVKVDKSFLLPSQKRLQINTFAFTASGPVFTFPKRIFVDEPQDFSTGGTDTVFLEALSEMRKHFADRAIVRAGVINEMVFDCGDRNSLEIVASWLQNSSWRSKAANLRLRLEMPEQQKNVNVEIRPTRLAVKAGQRPQAQTQTQPRYGIIVNVDINNQLVEQDLSTSQVRQTIDFAKAYVPDRLVELLNDNG